MSHADRPTGPDATSSDRLLKGVDERGLAGARRPLASPGRPRPSATTGQLLAGLAVDDRRRSPPTNCLVIGGCANDVKKLRKSLIKLGCPSRHSCRSTEVLVGR